MHPLFSGKGSLAERRYRLKQIQDLSPTAKRINVMALDPSSFSVIEEVALREARDNAHKSGRLFQSRERNDAGCMVTTYEGDINTWLKDHKRPGLVVTINKDPGMREETVRLRPGQRVQIVSD